MVPEQSLQVLMDTCLCRLIIENRSVEIYGTLKKTSFGSLLSRKA